MTMYEGATASEKGRKVPSLISKQTETMHGLVILRNRFCQFANKTIGELQPSPDQLEKGLNGQEKVRLETITMMEQFHQNNRIMNEAINEMTMALNAMQEQF